MGLEPVTLDPGSNSVNMMKANYIIFYIPEGNFILNVFPMTYFLQVGF